MPTLVARDPARWGSCEWGHFRWGVYTDRWERDFVPYMQALYMGARKEGARDPTTGGRENTYVWSSFSGWLWSRSAPSIHLPVGVYARQDAGLIAFDPLAHWDRVWDDDTQLMFVVADKPVKVLNPSDEGGGLAFWTYQLALVQNAVAPCITGL